jgi:hypothetical protein
MLLAGFDPVSLSALDQRAALLRRVDNKYVLGREAFEELAERLRGDHQVLEIDGRRLFSYSSTYFETPDLRCFVDHVEDRVPRFKARTRLYVDSGECVFEVKLKRSEGETDKRQVDYRQSDRRRLTDDAWSCVRGALDGAGLVTPEDLTASLTTSFDRVTIAPRDGSERLTCDFGVRATGPDGETAAMKDDLVLVETKSEAGGSPADRELAKLEISPISLSKYRVGMSLVGAASGSEAPPGSELFNSAHRPHRVAQHPG